MSAPEKPDPARGWQFVERLLDEDADRLAEMSDEDFEREMRERGVEVGEVPSAEELMARAAAKAAAKAEAGKAKEASGVREAESAGAGGGGAGAKLVVLPSASRARARRPMMPWLAAAAIVLAAVGLAALNASTIVAWWKGPPKGPPEAIDAGMPAPPEPPPSELARRLREEGTDECVRREFEECAKALAKADALDPAGAGEPRVAQARAAIFAWDDSRRDKVDYTKPGMASIPSERRCPAPPAGLAEQEAKARGLVAGLPPPYDLAADVAARTEAAKKRLGAAAVTHVEGPFVIAAARPGKVFDDGVNVARSAYAAYLHGRFSTRPTHAVTAYLFETNAAYGAECALHPDATCGHGDVSYFRGCLAREIYVSVAASSVASLAHEMVHPIMQEDFPRAPEWLQEGVASLYETHTLPAPGEIEGTDASWRLPVLKRALASEKLRGEVRLDLFFPAGGHALPDATFEGSDGAHVDEQLGALRYVMARYACRWLEKQGKLWALYRGWRDGYAGGDESGEKAFVRAVGKTPKDASGEWVAWVGGLP